jgi:anti-sigma factor RsiW
MTCPGARKLFQKHLDARLAAGEREVLEAHLAACRACAAELASWGAASKALRASGPTSAPRGLAARAWRAAMEERRPPSLAGAFVPVARRAALGAGILAVGVWLGVFATGSGRGEDVESSQGDPIEVAVQLWTAEAGADGE